MSEKQKKLLASLSIVIFIIFWVGIFYMIGRPLLQFVSEPEKFRAWVDSAGIWGRIVFLGMLILQVFVAIIPGEPLEIGAGYAFGALEGTLLCLIGEVLGGAAVFLFVRRFGKKALEIFFSKEKIDSLRFLQNTKKLDVLVFIVFFIPGTPKDLLCYAVGLTRMPFWTWIAISFIARIPSVITSTIGGDLLNIGNHTFALLVFVFTLVIAAGGIILYKKISKQ